LVRRTALDAVGGFDEAMSQTEDSDLVWRLAARFPVAAVPAALARYRHHPGQQHHDLATHERNLDRMLHKAFASSELPPDVQRLERQARANFAFAFAYEYGQRRSLRAAPRFARAFWYAPVRVTRWALRRLLRGARSRASSASRSAGRGP
jgi:GT2 family glycosyltransferase